MPFRALVMALGGLVSASDRRYRLEAAKSRQAELAPAESS